MMYSIKFIFLLSFQQSHEPCYYQDFKIYLRIQSNYNQNTKIYIFKKI